MSNNEAKPVPELPVFKIEKGVPIPTGIRFGGRKTRYPFEQMEKDDSFFVPADSTRRINTIRACVYHWAKKNKRVFITHVMPGGVRIWRVK